MRFAKLILASSAAIALTACGSEDVENTPVDDIDEIVDNDTEYDPMTRDYTLSEEAQARRDQFDEEATAEEYGQYRDEIMAEQDTAESMASEREDNASAMAASDGGSDSASGSSTDTMSSSDGASSSDMPERDANTNMRTRASMTWSYLDRDDSNRLSVAEYAIWAIPLDPTEPEPNDAKPPYVETEEINKAADSFFYYDIDGDSYLDRREFTAARRGENFDPQETTG